MASNQTVAHNWANCAVKGSKKGSSFYYELYDDNRVAIAYSFGSHYPAGIVDTVNSRVFINEYIYSGYTSKHLSCCRRAINKSFTPVQLSVSYDGMKELANFFRYRHDDDARQAYDRRWKSIVYETLRDNALASIKVYKGKMTKAGEPRMASGILWRYQNAIESASTAREFMGQKAVNTDPVRLKRYQDYVGGIKEKKEQQQKVYEEKRHREYLRSLCTPEKYAEWKQERLGYKDPSSTSHYSSYHRDELITLSVKENRVHTSNGNQVRLNMALLLLGIWDGALRVRKTFRDKEMEVEQYRGVCVRYNGTIKIGCTRILPDEVMRLKQNLLATGVLNGAITEKA